MTGGVIEASHWPLIAAAYAITFGAIAVMAAWIWLEGRRRAAILKRLEAAAPRQRARAERS